jgi:MFS transporter, NNP family, nitrate/nitrite transporter
VEVVPDQDYKASEFKLGSVARPHMRAFHCAWFGFFVAKFAWFAVVPLLPYMKSDLNLTDQDAWNANMISLTSLVLVRLLVGPLCDVYGPRVPFAVMLCLGSIPTALTGLVQNVTGLYIQRFFAGIVFGTLVSCEFWASRMFAKEVVGSANALVAGWGDLGSGTTTASYEEMTTPPQQYEAVTRLNVESDCHRHSNESTPHIFLAFRTIHSTGMSVLIVGSILLPLFQAMTHDDTVAWRTVCVVPAVLTFATGAVLYFRSDDSPRGNYVSLKKTDATLASRRPHHSLAAAARNANTWLLSFQYACCFGMELVMDTAMSAYFQNEFGLSRESALAVAGIFGWLEFFARPLGGIVSDLANARSGMRGRLWVQAITLLLQGSLVLVFASCKTLGGSIAALVFFSLFVKGAKGSTFGIVPYVSPTNMGSVIGVTGAGGNLGAIVFNLLLREVPSRGAMMVMGGVAMVSALFSALIFIPGHRGLFWGKDRKIDPETGLVKVKAGGGSSAGSGAGTEQ